MPEYSDEKVARSSEEISLKEIVHKIAHLFSYLRTKWRIILLSMIIGGVLGFSYSYFEKTYYTATLTFALEDEKNSGGGLSGALSIASSLGFDLGANAGGAFSGSNLMELMKSRRLVEQALFRPVKLSNGKITSIAEMYISFNNWRDKWEKKNPDLNHSLRFEPNSDRHQFSLQQDSVLEIIYSRLLNNNLVIEQKDKKVSIISIEVKTENELFSKYFAEALAKEVSDFYIDTKSKKAKMNVSILEKQTDSIRAELNNAITGVAVANDNTYNLNPALNVRRTPSARRQIDVQANTAILTELVKNLELARVTLRKETPLIQPIDSPILPLAKERPSKILFLISGSLLMTVIVLVGLIVKKWWSRIMNE